MKNKKSIFLILTMFLIGVFVTSCEKHKDDAKFMFEKKIMVFDENHNEFIEVLVEANDLQSFNELTTQYENSILKFVGKEEVREKELDTHLSVTTNQPVEEVKQAIDHTDEVARISYNTDYLFKSNPNRKLCITLIKSGESRSSYINIRNRTGFNINGPDAHIVYFNSTSSCVNWYINYTFHQVLCGNNYGTAYNVYNTYWGTGSLPGYTPIGNAYIFYNW